MRAYLGIVFLFLLASNMEAIAQNVPAEVYVEQLPEFDGDLSRWVGKYMLYPVEARENNQQGKVVMGFVVTKTGTLIDIKVDTTSGYKLLDNEAIRVIKLMPAWKPGKKNGLPVDMKYTLPLIFKLG